MLKVPEWNARQTFGYNLKNKTKYAVASSLLIIVNYGN